MVFTMASAVKRCLPLITCPKNITGEVECADLATSVGEQLVAAYRTRLDLMHLFGEFFFAINSAFFAGEIAQADDRI